MNTLKALSDELLAEAYEKAKKLNLNKDFLMHLESEIQRRDLNND
ncbi:sporulation histidine kinase inhibitor Sda [Salicibibacter cibarius]|uniref:Sporulation histidine kinase inhibitor Sda n=1 Tax=Salicibibacter cibarius TaxID=2743000 RepID=A0A7T6Z735_9BACI|nr:sporulation histidine kinase inhibitor Sda [Salicibibacter cibarius]QQK78192.1 sporulation histidine kinase inhibitor Sda [Salicibibacter cibarius]QQK78195.1 sporulation histidine kinase inhibitor Sda [Salicibibacter cibarius]